MPFGIDPEFMVALPPEMRADAINDFLRQTRLEGLREAVINQAPAAAVTESAEDTTLAPTIDQEFLNALPADIQEEVSQKFYSLRNYCLSQVLQQQREAQNRARNAEQQVQQQQQQQAPEDMANETAAFFASLPPSLRRQVLADADESVMATLPNDLRQEANDIRQERAQMIIWQQRAQSAARGNGQPVRHG